MRSRFATTNTRAFGSRFALNAHFFPTPDLLDQRRVSEETAAASALHPADAEIRVEHENRGNKFIRTKHQVEVARDAQLLISNERMIEAGSLTKLRELSSRTGTEHEE